MQKKKHFTKSALFNLRPALIFNATIISVFILFVFDWECNNTVCHTWHMVNIISFQQYIWDCSLLTSNKTDVYIKKCALMAYLWFPYFNVIVQPVSFTDLLIRSVWALSVCSVKSGDFLSPQWIYCVPKKVFRHLRHT